MNIKNRRFIILSCSLIFASFIIILVLASISIYGEYSTSQARRAERINRLRMLLCEEIKLGMSKDQVINILEQKGKIRINGNYDEPNLNLGIVYVDSPLNEYYGSFDIVISDYKYVGSYISYFDDDYDTICSLR